MHVCGEAEIGALDGHKAEKIGAKAGGRRILRACGEGDSGESVSFRRHLCFAWEPHGWMEVYPMYGVIN